jgi:hypothetical protein
MTTTISETNQETTETPFKVGDRVRVIDLFMESGREGTIKFLPASNGDDCTVEIDGGLCLSYNFKNLAKIEAELDVDDDEPEVAPTPAFAAGDIVVISSSSVSEAWVGLRFVVASAKYVDLYLENGSIDTRPDGYSSNFNWPIDKLRAFDPARDFKVGDIVDAPRYKSKGVVTELNPTDGGDIEVNWTEGLGSLVAYGSIGATRRYLTVIGVDPESVEPEPEPEAVAEFEPAFKKGDRLEVVGNSPHNPAGKHHYEVGTIVTATSDARESGAIGVEGYSFRYFRDLFQTLLVTDLVAAPEPEPLKVGDRVKVIDNGGSDDAILDALGTVTKVGSNELLTVEQDNGLTCQQFAFRFEATDEPAPEPEPEEFKVGDRVKVIDARGHSKAELYALGTVTRLDDELIEVLQDNGVTCHQLAFRFEATDEPKPLMAGQSITTKEEADRLPMGSVVVCNGEERSPQVKLSGGLFGRINRYGVRGSGMERDVIRAYDETKRVHRLISDADTDVVLVFLPGESA